MVLLTGALLAPVATADGSGTNPNDYTSANLPDWAIGPFTNSSSNPLMAPDPNTSWKSHAVFNPGVVYRDNQYKMLYRAENSHLIFGNNGLSQIGYASSADGIQFTSSTNPVITNNVSPQDSSGVEDPRLYEMNGTYYTFFTGVPTSGSRNIMEAYSTDGMKTWSTAVAVASPGVDAAVVTDGNDTPVKVNGQYLMYFGDHSYGTDFLTSPDMVHWSGKTQINMHLPAQYGTWEICLTVTDYQSVQNGPVNNNIVMFMAGTMMAQGRWFYAISEVEFSRSDPTKQLAQLTEPVLSPTPAQAYEWEGVSGGTKLVTPQTVWMNSIMFHDGQWRMYYGAGDTYIALATAPLRSGPATPFAGTSFETGQRYPDWPDQLDASATWSGSSNVGGLPGVSGPQASIRYKEKAHTGSLALMYSGSAKGGASDYAYMRVFDTSSHPPTIDSGTTLSYWIYPSSSAVNGVTGNNSTCVALDMDFADGTQLRNLGARDQNGNVLHPARQCGHLVLDQWNHVTVNIGAVAAGKNPLRIVLGYDQPGSTGGYHGYIDDISITG